MAPLHRQFATAETACLTLLGAVRDGSNQLRTKYTEEALQAGLEGTVILDFVVGEDGRVRDVKVVQGLGHGLTEAAVRAAKACRFTIGERDGKAVPVRVARFKVRFAVGETE